MKKIMIIGAGWEQEPIIEKAKSIGLYVIATHPSEDADGFVLSDESFVVSPRNLDKLEEIYSISKPDAITSDACDYSMFATAYLTNKYGLPGPNMDSVLITNNKYLQRRCAERELIDQPQYRLCMTYAEVVEAAGELGYPNIIKPVDNRGAIGVHRVDSIDELRKCFYEALSSSHARQVIIEEFIDGDMQVNVEGIVAGNCHTLICANKRKYEGLYVDKDLHYPGDMSSELIKRIEEANDTLVKAVGIDRGMIHVEYVVKNDKPYLIEMHNRGAGINVANKIVPEVTGVDTPEVIIKQSLGDSVHIDDYKRRAGHAILHFFDFGRGRVERIDNVDRVKAMEGVLRLWINFNEGDVLENIENGPSRHGCVIVAGDSKAHCDKMINNIESAIKVIIADQCIAEKIGVVK